MTFRIDRITLTLDVYQEFDRRNITVIVDQPPQDAPIVVACVQAWADDYAKTLREAQARPPQTVGELIW